ncbi:hypothetical protein BSNK01_11870 [Bacillaceae bacterium]
MALWIEDGQKLYECEVDALAMAIKRQGVLSGCQVTKSSTAMAIDVSAGILDNQETKTNVSAVTALAITAADPTFPRKDIVVADLTNGSVSVLTGTPAAIPKPPVLPANKVLLALIDVPAGATDIMSVDIHDRRLLLYQEAENIQTATLTHGLNVLNTDQKTLLKPRFFGRTLVNLLGKLGNMEETGKNGLKDVTEILDTTNYVVGKASLKYTASGSGSIEHYATIGTGARINGTKIKPNAYYVAIGLIKPNVGKAQLRVITFNADDTVSVDISSTNISDTSKFSIAVLKFSTGANVVSAEVRCQLLDINGNRLFTVGTTAENANFDAFRLYEIDQATYNKIDVDPEYTGDKLAEKFPYIDSVQAVQNPYIVKYGKNLLPPFTDPAWSIHANAKVLDDYKLQLDATAPQQETEIVLRVLPNQTYTLSFASLNGRYAVNYYSDEAGTRYISNGGYQTGTTFTFITPVNCKSIKIYVDGATSGTFTFDKPMLNIGSQPLPFEPQNNEYLFLETKLYSDVSGTVRDEVYYRDGELWKIERFREVVIDSSITWTLLVDKTGYKTIISTTKPISNKASGYTLQQYVGIKYDGKILISAANDDVIDKIIVYDNSHANAGNIAIAIADTDSGWGETYTPTAAEIKAYFYGWRMCNGTYGTPYNGSGTKTWHPIGDTDLSRATTTTPTTPAPTIAEGKIDYYRLVYQLANAEEVPVKYEGEIMLHEGANVLELSEGVVIREQANPVYEVTGKNYHINNQTLGNPLKYRTQKILQINRNADEDHLWDFVNSASAYGIQLATIAGFSFDPTAAYSVTYLVLDRYLFTVNALSADVEYATNLKTVVDQLVQEHTELSRDVSVLENEFRRQFYEKKVITATTRDMVLYVDPVNGNDSSDGTKPFKTIQAAINSLPQIINHTVTINLSAGTYNEGVVIEGFVGKGQLNLYGGTSSANASNYKVNYVNINKNAVRIDIQGIEATATGAYGFFVKSNPSHVTISGCRCVSSSSSNVGVSAWDSAAVRVISCEISNRLHGIYSQNSRVASVNNSGSGNTYGLGADYAGVIGKSGTQPAGATAEWISVGGVIR